MARKIRFPLHMSDGADVRTIEELQEHFDIESVLGYFADGKLKTWLEDRYYDEQAAAVGELSSDMPDLGAKLSAIFGIEAKDTELDIEKIQRRKEKLRILSAFTADKDILDNVDLVAMDQDELNAILDISPEKVFLFCEKFIVPITKKNITYFKLNGATVALEDSIFEYKESGILFEDINLQKQNENVERIVEDEDDILNVQSASIVYLSSDYGRYEIPFIKNNIKYIGKTNPDYEDSIPYVILEKNKHPRDYYDNGITFENVIIEVTLGEVEITITDITGKPDIVDFSAEDYYVIDKQKDSCTLLSKDVSYYWEYAEEAEEPDIEESDNLLGKFINVGKIASYVVKSTKKDLDTEWYNSELRKRLNEDYEDMDDDEQSLIIQSHCENNKLFLDDQGNSYTIKPRKDTHDFLYCLSYEEAKKLPIEIRAAGEEYWLRDIGSFQGAFVASDGSIHDTGKGKNETCGVRPVMKIKLRL